MGWLIVLAVVGAIGYGAGFWIGWWKRHKLGLVVENDLSKRLAEAREEASRLRCELSGMDAASEVLEELMYPEESSQ